MSGGGGGEEDGGKEGRMRAGWQPTKLEPHTEMWGIKNLCNYTGVISSRFLGLVQRVSLGRALRALPAPMRTCTR